MGFSEPKPGFPSPDVTNAFLSPFASSRFAVDHIVTTNGTAAWPSLRGDASAPWVLGPNPSSLVVYKLSLDAFRCLQVATSRSDGGFVLIRDVRLADGSIVQAGSVGRLQAITEANGERVAVCVSAERGRAAVIAGCSDVPPDAAAPVEPVASPVRGSKPTPRRIVETQPMPSSQPSESPAP